ncbi:hypothetical protein SGFS_098610 [Streptomyces graminofaciens]|uniref:Uncharacterized protein n=1 Tax=Streptomyces graminofaciens TaxID=68212 RepID=A0ABN5W4L4_9ACTN|nr:hypothetical protein [Streptomyces graminofaciens]BBC38567.1 hypothetical protein SGFS_098610 [Streptomyces graminofaciens]
MAQVGRCGTAVEHVEDGIAGVAHLGDDIVKGAGEFRGEDRAVWEDFGAVAADAVVALHAQLLLKHVVDPPDSQVRPVDGQRDG